MKRQEFNDSDLIAMYKNGSEDAFALLVEKHKNKLYTAIYMIVKDQCAAEDILQETFIKVIDTIKSGKYNEEGKFIQWVSRIAHNLAIDHFRKHKRYPSRSVDENHSIYNSLDFAEESFENKKVRSETYSQMREMVKGLPKPQREVLIMRHFLQMSFQEIADATGVSINTALGRMRYALINLRKLINDKAYADKKRSYQG